MMPDRTPTVEQVVRLRYENSKVHQLAEQLKHAPFKVAPENSFRLRNIVDQRGIRIQVDVTATTFSLYAENNHIRIGLSSLEMLWTTMFLIFRTFAGKTNHPGGVLENLRSDIGSVIVNLSTPPSDPRQPWWPIGMPTPADSADIVRQVNTAFLVAGAWILLHETGHIFYRHEPYDERVLNHITEFDADEWAAKHMMPASLAQADNGDFMLRALGVAFGLLTLTGICIHYDTVESTAKHPSILDRILRIFDFLDGSFSNFEKENLFVQGVVGYVAMGAFCSRVQREKYEGITSGKEIIGAIRSEIEGSSAS